MIATFLKTIEDLTTPSNEPDDATFNGIAFIVIGMVLAMSMLAFQVMQLIQVERVSIGDKAFAVFSACVGLVVISLGVYLALRGYAMLGYGKRLRVADAVIAARKRHVEESVATHVSNRKN